MTSTTIDEEEVFFANLHAKLLLRIVELTHPLSFGKRAERELSGVRSSKLDDLEPCDLVWTLLGVAGCPLMVRSYNLWRRVEATLETLDENWSQWPCAQVGGQRLMSI